MPQSKSSAGRMVLFVLFLLLTIVTLAGVSISTGSSDVTVGEAHSAILHKFFSDRYAPSWLAEVCVWNLRLPRILIGILAGISLGTAGATMQWALKNPLASPYTLGILSSAGSGASLAIIAGAGIVGGKYLTIGAAFIFTLIATAIILYISSRRWATPARVVLIGIVMTIIFSAMTAQFHQFGTSDVKEAVFLMVGNLNRASWGGLAYMSDMLVFCVILLILLIYLAPLSGVADKRIRTSAMVVASLLVAITVCFTGVIGFIGLLAPHICRRVIGDDHRFVILVSGLVGVVLLLGSDLVARTVISPVILPVGWVTAVMGAPLFIYLLIKMAVKAISKGNKRG